MANREIVVRDVRDCPFFNDDVWGCNLYEIGADNCNKNYDGQIPPDCPLRVGVIMVRMEVRNGVAKAEKTDA